MHTKKQVTAPISKVASPSTTPLHAPLGLTKRWLADRGALWRAVDLCVTLSVIGPWLVAPLAAQGKASASFQLRAVSSIGAESERTAGVSIGDLDGDGDLDLVFANGRHWPAQNRIFWNNGGGRFTLSSDLGALRDTSYAVPLGDLDGDGDLDAVVANDLAPNLVLLNSDGTGAAFGSGTAYGEIDSSRGAVLADLDGDAHLDVILTNRGMENRIHFGDGSGAFARSAGFGTASDSTISVAVGDVDGDGDLDLLLANRDGQSNQVQLNDGDGRFTPGAPFGTGSDETRAVATGDLDGDGRLDLVLANIGESNAVLLGDGRGEFAKRFEFGANDAHSYAVALADLDLDGNLDIVIANADRNNVAVLVSRNEKGLEFAAMPFGSEDSVTYGVAVGDVNGDRSPEIVTANSDGLNYLFTRIRRPRRR